MSVKNNQILRQRELVLLSHVLGKHYLNNKYALRILPSKYIEQEDKSKVNAYSKLSFIQERKPVKEIQRLVEAIPGKERQVRKIPEVLQKNLPNVDDLLKDNDDDMEDQLGNINNNTNIEFYFQTLKQLVQQVRQDAQLIEKNTQESDLDESEKQIDYIHTDYIIYVLKYRFKNLQANQYSKQSMFQTQYAIYIVYLILFKSDQIKELPYDDDLYAIFKKVFSPILKELCYKIFDKQFSFDEEIKKFETFIAETIENIDQKVLVDSGEGFVSEAEDGELSEPEVVDEF